MDRNVSNLSMSCSAEVALRKESVDRNSFGLSCFNPVSRSLSARRAWIEMTYVTRLPRCQVVALRKESVDRNMISSLKKIFAEVALRKESVDRNLDIDYYKTRK